MTIPPPIFSVQVMFGRCYISGQWGQVQNKLKNALTYFQELFWQFLLFFIIKVVFLSLCTL